MKDIKALCALFSLLLLFAGTIDARKDLREYWSGVMKDQVMPESIQGLIPNDPVSTVSNAKADCHSSEDFEHKMERPFVKNIFETNSDILIYHDDMKPTKEKYFARKFELMPDILICDNGNKPTGKKFFIRDLELMPDLSIYDNKIKPSEEKFFIKNFEPKADISLHDNDIKSNEQQPVVSNFESSPDASIYHQ